MMQSDTRQEQHKDTARVEVKHQKSLTSLRTIYIIVPPDGGWGWIVVLGAFFSYFISDGLQYSFGIFLVEISENLKCTTSQVSLAGAINTCVFCISGPFSAALVNKYGYRSISICGSIIATLSCILTSFSVNIYLVFVFHGFIGGIGFGMIYITALIAVGFYFERWRGLATGISVCGAGIGGISLPPLLSIIMDRLGWRNTFRIVSAGTALIILCGSLFRPIKPTRIHLPTSSKSDRTQVESKASFFDRYKNTAYERMLPNAASFTSEQILTTYMMDSKNSSGKSVKYADMETEIRDESDYALFPRKRGSCCTNKCYSRCCTGGRRNNLLNTPSNTARPIYREDIFYTGSLATIPEYRKSFHKLKASDLSGRNLEYQLSITRTSTHDAMVQTSEEEKKCKSCPNAVKRTLATMLDFRLLKCRNFNLLILNAIFTSLGIYIPYMFIKTNAERHGFDSHVSSWLISAIGLTNTFGRISCGLLSTVPHFNAIVLCYCFLFVGGIATILSTISYVSWVQFVFCATFGLSMSSISALRTLIVVKLVGLENLTNAIGIILLFQGMASLSGLTIAGKLVDATKVYEYCFYFGGGCITLGALFLIILHITYRNQT